MSEYSMQTGRFRISVAASFWEEQHEAEAEPDPVAGFLEVNTPPEFVAFLCRLTNQGTSSSWSEWAWRPLGPCCCLHAEFGRMYFFVGSP